jgi:hypothetical protein
MWNRNSSTAPASEHGVKANTERPNVLAKSCLGLLQPMSCQKSMSQAQWAAHNIHNFRTHEIMSILSQNPSKSHLAVRAVSQMCSYITSWTEVDAFIFLGSFHWFHIDFCMALRPQLSSWTSGAWAPISWSEHRISQNITELYLDVSGETGETTRTH